MKTKEDVAREAFHRRIGFDPGEYAVGPVPRIGVTVCSDRGGHPDVISGFQICRQCFSNMQFKEGDRPVVMMLRTIIVTECKKCGHTQAVELRLT